MPEYLAPGVFVEEVSYRSKSIQGVATSTTGFAGLTHFGPVRYAGGPRNCEPRLITSYAEFERVYGGLTQLDIGGGRVPYLAHAARAFFLNGGRRLYVSRVFRPQAIGDLGVASVPIGAPAVARFRARWPGSQGNLVVDVAAQRGGDVALHPAPLPANPPAGALRGNAHPSPAASHGMIVELVEGGLDPNGAEAAPTMPTGDRPINLADLRFLWMGTGGIVQFIDSAGQDRGPARHDTLVLPITVTVTVTGRERNDVYPRLGIARESKGSISRVLSWDDPADDDAVVSFEALDNNGAPIPPGLPPQPPTGAPQGTAGPVASLTLLSQLVTLTNRPPHRQFALVGGNDGALAIPDDFDGLGADPDDFTKKASGLKALAEVDDIAIVALPDAGGLEDPDAMFTATQFLIRHAEDCRYRIAVVDGPRHASINRIRSFRGNFDSKYAAIYHPWIEILDPNGPPAPGVPTPRLQLPPSGFVTGIYARNDITRGVFKAPANEVVYGLTKFEMNINQGRNEVLNPENINALRFFPGRGNRVWGARTMTSDPEWMYVNVRRFFIFLEHSIDKATQWAVFEPNGEALWRNITRTVSDFLEVQWRGGALLGATPEDAFFVQCDRSTMSQNDLDNGRLICLIGVAAVKPAEFVIFRIGQWTASAKG